MEVVNISKKGQYNKEKYPYEEYHKEVDGVLYKKCAYHHELFPEETSWFPCTAEYYYKNDKNKKDGLYPECKKCTSAKSMQWKLDNPEKDKINDARYRSKPNSKKNKRISNKKRKKLGKEREWQQKNPERVRYHALKHRNHDITNREWESCLKFFGHRCAYCGITLEESLQIYNQKLHKEHVDGEGYNDIRNCVPACRDCNDRKWAFPMEEWYKEQEYFCEDKLTKIYQWCNEEYKKYIEQKLPYKIKRKKIPKGDNTYYWQYELWIFDEKRNLIECMTVSKNKDDLKPFINELKK